MINIYLHWIVLPSRQEVNVAKVKIFNKYVDMTLQTGTSTGILEMKTFDVRQLCYFNIITNSSFCYCSKIAQRALSKIETLRFQKEVYYMNYLHCMKTGWFTSPL